MSETVGELFDMLATVLLYCWVFSILLLWFWFGVYKWAGGFVHRLHGRMFGLSPHELDVMFYCGMGLFKLGVILLFFLPWLAIRLIL